MVEPVSVKRTFIRGQRERVRHLKVIFVSLECLYTLDPAAQHLSLVTICVSTRGLSTPSHETRARVPKYDKYDQAQSSDILGDIL